MRRRALPPLQAGPAWTIGCSLRPLPPADVAAGLHSVEQPIDHLRCALGRTDVAELDAGDLTVGLGDVEPYHLAGAQIDQAGIAELPPAADVGGAEADEAAGDAEHLQRNPSGRREAVLSIEEQGIVEPGA